MKLSIVLSTIIATSFAYSMGSGSGYATGGSHRVDYAQQYGVPMASNYERNAMAPVSKASQQPQQMSRGQPTSYDNYEVIFDSQRDGWNHPWVVYDSRRDGLDSPLRSQFDNDPNLNTIFDSKVDGWNHPWVVYDSRRDGLQRNY